MSKCPKCGNNLQLIEDGKYYCSVCNKTYKTKSQPQYQPVRETPSVVASTQNAESAKDKEIELLKARLDALERGNSAPKQSKTKVAIQSSKAVLFIKKYGVIIFPVLLLLIAFITLMTCLVGIRGIYVNVNDPNEFYSFTATSYEYHGKSMLGGGDYVDKGTWKKSGNTLSLTYDDEDFGKITEDCVIIKNENNKLLVIEDDMGREKTFKRVSIVDYSANIKKVKVTFDPCNGDSPIVKRVKIGSQMPEFPEPTQRGYDFLGWNTQQYGQGNPAPESKRVWEDVTYYANWSMKLIVENGVLKGIEEQPSDFWHLDIPNNVTSISSSAFIGCRKLTSVTIPDSVTSIGINAFYKCFSLVEVLNKSQLTISKGSEENGYIGCYAINVSSQPFESKLTQYDDYLIYESDNDKILVSWNEGIWDGVGYDLILPEGIIEIYPYAFYQCGTIRSVTIPDSVASIGSFAFYQCQNIERITLPDSVTSIGDCAFYQCTVLTSITIPNSVTNIGVSAFYNCNGLTSITIPDSVTSIGSSMFSSCHGLTNITIPDSVTSIGSYAFFGSDVLTSIIFNGTKAQWMAIKKIDGWTLGTPDFVIHCTDGDLDKNGNEI